MSESSPRGAPGQDAGPPHAGDLSDADAFLDRFIALTPHTPVTFVILSANLAAFAVMVASGVSWLQPETMDLRTWGGNYAPATTGGEWWRLASSVFIHGGALHLALTGFSLWSVGRFVERLIGHCGLAVAYLGAGAAGALCSAAWNPHVTSVGSSGAIFGLLGTALGCFVRSRPNLPPAVLSPLRRNIVLVVVLNLALGFLIPGIDNAAHLGGLATGFCLGLVLGCPLTVEGVRRRGRAAALVAITAGAALFAATLALPDFPDMPRELDRARAIESTAHAHASQLVRARLAGQVDDHGLAAAMEATVLRPLRTERARLLALTHVPAYHQPYREAVLRVLEARIQAYDMLLEVIGDPKTHAVSPEPAP